MSKDDFEAVKAIINAFLLSVPDQYDIDEQVDKLATTVLAWSDKRQLWCAVAGAMDDQGNTVVRVTSVGQGEAPTADRGSDDQPAPCADPSPSVLATLISGRDAFMRGEHGPRLNTLTKAEQWNLLYGDDETPDCSPEDGEQ